MKYLEYLDDFEDTPCRNKKGQFLECITSLMTKLENPHKQFKSIHVAGTNGKTSVINTLFSVLCCAGYKVGKFASRYTYEFGEQIQINGENITDEEIEEYLEVLKPLVKEQQEANIYVNRRDILTSVAFMHFAKYQVDIALVESSFGGLFDSTNIISPLVSVITKIDSDAGDRLGEITEDIVGIIKQNTPVITSNFSTSLTIITNKAIAMNADIIRVASKNTETTHFNISKPMRLTYGGNHYFTALKGRHQGINTAIALECFALLNNIGFNIETNHIENGFAGVDTASMFEVMSRKPLVIFDSASNLSGLKALMQNVEDYFWGNIKKTVFIVVLEKSKNLDVFMAVLAKHMPRGGNIIFTNGIGSNFYLADELFDAYVKSDKRYSVTDYIAKRRTHSIAYCINNFPDALSGAIKEHGHDAAIMIIGGH